MQPEFEYKCMQLTSDGQWETLLNEMGKDGWELVQIDIWGTMPTPVAFMKRIAP